MQTIFTVNVHNFDERVLQVSNQTPVLVDFWAEWCPPCLAIAPTLEKVVNEYDGEILLAKCEVDEDENMKLAGRYKTRGFPSILLFSNEKELDRFSGAKPRQFIENFIDQHL